MPYYAVVNGRNPGLYYNWEDCKDQVHQYSGSQFRKFDSRGSAERYLNDNGIYLDSSSEDSSSYYSDDSYYSESSESDSQLTEDEDGFVNVYTDGCCLNNGTANASGGIGVWFRDNHYLNVSKPLYGRQTNNRAEIKAVTFAARQAVKADIYRLIINTDSRFLYKCLTQWMKMWKSNGWRTSDGRPVINKDDLIEMEDALSDLQYYHLNRIPGHSGIHGNMMADKLARQGALMN